MENFDYCLIGNGYIILTNGKISCSPLSDILIENVQTSNISDFNPQFPITIIGDKINYDFLFNRDFGVDKYEESELKTTWLRKRKYAPMGWNRLKNRTRFEKQIYKIVSISKTGERVIIEIE